MLAFLRLQAKWWLLPSPAGRRGGQVRLTPGCSRRREVHHHTTAKPESPAHQPCPPLPCSWATARGKRRPHTARPPCPREGAVPHTQTRRDANYVSDVLTLTSPATRCLLECLLRFWRNPSEYELNRKGAPMVLGARTAQVSTERRVRLLAVTAHGSTGAGRRGWGSAPLAGKDQIHSFTPTSAGGRQGGDSYRLTLHFLSVNERKLK